MAAVGFFIKLQHKGQLLSKYLARAESFVNSQESVPLSFTGKTTHLLLSKKQVSLMWPSYPTPPFSHISQMSPTY